MKKDKIDKEIESLRILSDFSEQYENEFSDDNNDSAEIETKNNKIGFIAPWLYEGYEFEATNKSICFPLKNLLDDVCFKKKIIKLSKSGKTVTPNSLKQSHLISAGRYTDWKAFVHGSYIENIFGMNESVFVIKKFKKMLGLPEIALLIMNTCAEIDDDLGSGFWDTVEQAFESYNENRELILKEKDIDYLAVILTGKHYERVSLRIDNNSSEDSITDERIQQIEILKRRLADFYAANCIEDAGKQDFNKDNVPANKLKFSEYLAPIVAATAEHSEYNPFFTNTAVWTNSIKKCKLKGSNSYPDSMMDDYSVLQAYAYYRDELDSIYSDADFLFKYELYINRILGKVVSEYNPCKGIDKYVQLYAIESMLHPQLIDILAISISERKLELKDLYFDSRLGIIIFRLARMNPFVSVGVAQNIVDTYFENNKSASTIHEMFDQCQIVERQLLLSWSQMSESRSSNLKSIISMNLPVLIGRYEEMMNFEEQTRLDKYPHAEKHRDLSIKDYISFTQSNMEHIDFIDEKIKKWVIKSIFSGILNDDIKFKEDD